MRATYASLAEPATSSFDHGKSEMLLLWRGYEHLPDKHLFTTASQASTNHAD
jgi:hypothetical protein